MWSFGCILYELLTSKVLFRQKDLHQIIAQSISLSLSRKLQQSKHFTSPFKAYDSFGQNRKGSDPFSSLVNSRFESPSSYHRKAEILSRDSNEWNRKNSARQKVSVTRGTTEDEKSQLSQENKSGKTEVRRVWGRERSGTGGEKSNISNDTRRKEKTGGRNLNKSARGVDYSFSKLMKNIFETFKDGRKYNDLISQGILTRLVDQEKNV